MKSILVAIAFLFISSMVSAAGPKSYGLYFPKPFIKSGERIDQIDISVSCGHVGDKNCFDISAKLLVHAAGVEREIRFSRTQLRLLP